MTPTLCPQCLAANVIATVAGPTCYHQPNTGTLWFPSWWNQAGRELDRIAFLNGRAPK